MFTGTLVVNPATLQHNLVRHIAAALSLLCDLHGLAAPACMQHFGVLPYCISSADRDDTETRHMQITINIAMTFISANNNLKLQKLYTIL